jgi:predicted O-methyltransferase YrrM
MSKLSKLFKAIGIIIRNPWMLNHIIDSDEEWKKYVTHEYSLEKGLPVVSPEILFGDFEVTVNPMAMLDGGSMPTDLALLQMLSRKFACDSYFEIGTWRGESVSNVADYIKDCYTLNLSASQMKDIGLNQKYIDLHGFFSKDKKNVVHLEGDSRDFDFEGLNKKFDLIFIDGDHHYNMVKNDTEEVFKHLVHDKSIVVWHDYAHNPEKVRFEVLAAILDGTPSSKHKQLYHFANSMSAIYISEDLKTMELDPPERPDGHYEITLRKVKHH